MKSKPIQHTIYAPRLVRGVQHTSMVARSLAFAKALWYISNL